MQWGKASKEEQKDFVESWFSYLSTILFNKTKKQVEQKLNRVEIIDENGRSYVNWDDSNNAELSLQDNGRTLKIFISKDKGNEEV